MMIKRHTTIFPFILPRLTDKAAAQLLDVLHQFVGAIEHHYAEQLHHYRKRQTEIGYARHPQSSDPADPPF